MRILLVEDNLVLGEALRDHLAATGHDADWRTCLSEAMGDVVSDAFDIILLDLRLPDGNGLTLLRHVRRSSQIPVIVMTAFDQMSDRLEALKSGATDFMVKPFDLDALSERIRRTAS